MEPVRLREAGFAELRPGPPADIGRGSGEECLDVTMNAGQVVGHLHEARVVHLLEFCLNGTRDCAERGQRSGPGLAERRDIALELLQRLVHASILHPPTDIHVHQKPRLTSTYACGEPSPEPACGGQVDA